MMQHFYANRYLHVFTQPSCEHSLRKCMILQLGYKHISNSIQLPPNANQRKQPNPTQPKTPSYMMTSLHIS
jgi:hypothetical protein